MSRPELLPSEEVVLGDKYHFSGQFTWSPCQCTIGLSLCSAQEEFPGMVSIITERLPPKTPACQVTPVSDLEIPPPNSEGVYENWTELSIEVRREINRPAYEALTDWTGSVVYWDGVCRKWIPSKLVSLIHHYRTKPPETAKPQFKTVYEFRYADGKTEFWADPPMSTCWGAMSIVGVTKMEKAV